MNPLCDPDLLRRIGGFCDARCLGHAMAVARLWYAALRPAVDVWPVHRPMDDTTLRRMVDAGTGRPTAAHVVLSDGGSASADDEVRLLLGDHWEAVVGVVSVSRRLTAPWASLRIDLVGGAPGGRKCADAVNPAVQALARSPVLQRVRAFELRVFRQNTMFHPGTLFDLVRAITRDPRCRLESLRFHTDQPHWVTLCDTALTTWRMLVAFAMRSTTPNDAVVPSLEAFDLRFDRCPNDVGRWFVPVHFPPAATGGRLRILRLRLPHGEWYAREGNGLDALLDAVAAQDRLQTLHLDLSHAYLRGAWRNGRRPLAARGLRSARLVVRSAGLDVRGLCNLLAWVLTVRKTGPLECTVDARDNKFDGSPAEWSAFPWRTERAWSDTDATLSLDLRKNNPPLTFQPIIFPLGVRCVVDPADPNATNRDRGAPTSIGVVVDDGDDIDVWTA